ncbi:MAG: hypothetical protein M5U34_32315 [Chloroflexi bacterium]|nr:hypothetical protein [Chloroflexota bacterium]
MMAFPRSRCPPERPLPTLSFPGDRQAFKLLNIDSITIQEIDAELKASATTLIFGLKRRVTCRRRAPQSCSAWPLVLTPFTTQVTGHFGAEDNPGIDGDPRIHIVNADPGTLCDNAYACGLLGYFSASDTVPAHYEPNSNEREMFVTNGQEFGTVGYLDTLSHEFRHMVEDHYDSGDIDWAVEGSATLSQDLSGFSEDPISRANLFLLNTDQQAKQLAGR